MQDSIQREYIVFDVETTGLSPTGGDRIIEIAALKVRDMKICDKFYSLVDPQREISYGAYQVNGISQEMVAQAPTAEKILPDFLDFIGQACLVGHNVKFDISFLCNELELMGLELSDETKAVDTIKMARTFMPNLGSYPLWFVARSLGINIQQEHRAMADVELTFNVFQRLMTKVKENHYDDFEVFLNMFGEMKAYHRKFNQEKVSVICDAIDEGKVLDVVYASANRSAPTPRKVTPQKLVRLNGKVFLIGFCHLRDEERGFRIDRILKLKIL